MHDGSRNEEKLQKIFTNVNDWLKFAEAKNAALLALTGAATLSILNLDSTKVSCSLFCYLTHVTLPLLGITIIIVLASFIAHTKPFFVSKKSQNQLPEDNLLFFGDVSKYKAEEYLQALYDKGSLDKNAEIIRSIELEYAQQIVYNSKIAATKYKLFNTALLLLFSAILTPVVAVPLYFIYKSNR